MKSQFFPGGRNCKLLLIFSLVAIVSVQASALIITEDFNGYTSKPLTSEFDNGIFHHNIIETNPPGSNWDISTFNSSGTPFADNALNLLFVQDIVTFDLASGQHIDFASVKAINWGPTIIIFDPVNGTDHTVSITTPSGWFTYDTSGLGLGSLQSITLYSYDGAFDDLEVNVVPEPISILLVGAGSVLVLRRRKSK